MTGPARRLPAGFESLEPFVDAWALPTTAERALRRGASSEAERQSFYDAAKELLPGALEHLDKKPIGRFDEADKSLMNLMLALTHVALAIEVQGPDEASHRAMRDYMRITGSPADRNP